MKHRTHTPLLSGSVIRSLISLWRERTGRANRGALPPDRLSPGELREVSSAIRDLTHRFNHRRETIGYPYLDDPRLLGAYLLYFWPLSYLQAGLLLHSVMRLTGLRTPGRCLDIGCGPAPMGLAALDCGADALTGIDHSAAALNLAVRIAQANGHSIAAHRTDIAAGQPLPEGPFDCIVMGHMLNELWQGHADRISRRVNLVTRALEHLSPQGILLIIEPALMETARELASMREKLVDRGCEIVAPCTGAARCAICDNSSVTCHATFDWDMPPLIAALSAAAGPDREQLKMAYLCVAPAQSPHGQAMKSSASRYRVVSDHMVNKAGRDRLFLCGLQGRISVSIHRNEGWPATSRWFSLKRGDLVEITDLVARNDNQAVGASTRIRVIQSAG